MEYRFATLDDVTTLTRMNRRLVEGERHRNRFKSDAWFEERIRGLLTGRYKPVGFKEYSLELEIPASKRGAAQGERTHPRQG